ncbi:MAG: hypothetical protein AAGB10_23350 [Pseudomonadota bacterium]
MERTTFQTLNRTVRNQSAHLLLDHADLVLTLWPDGDIRDVRLGPGTILAVASDALVGRPVGDLACGADQTLIETLIARARAGQSTAPVNIRHSALVSSGTKGLYTAHLAADGKNVLFVGRLQSTALKAAERLVEAEIARQTLDRPGRG